MPDESALRPVIDLRFELVIGFRERIEIATEMLIGKLLHHLGRIVDAHGKRRLDIEEMGRANDVFRTRTAGGVIEIVELDAHEDIHAALVQLLERSDSLHIVGPYHMDIGIHMT